MFEELQIAKCKLQTGLTRQNSYHPRTVAARTFTVGPLALSTMLNHAVQFAKEW
jgi:hypothetical protein